MKLKNIKVGKDFTEEEKENAFGEKGNKLTPQYCDKCKTNGKDLPKQVY